MGFLRGKKSIQSEERQIANFTSPSKDLAKDYKKYEKRLKENSKKYEELDRKNKKSKEANKQLIKDLDILADSTKDPREALEKRIEAQSLKNEMSLMEQSDTAAKSSGDSLRLKMASIIKNDPIHKLKEFGSTPKDLMLDTAEQAGMVYSVTKSVFELFSDKIKAWRNENNPAKIQKGSGILGKLNYWMRSMGYKISTMLLNIFNDPNPNVSGIESENLTDDAQDTNASNYGITKQYEEGYDKGDYKGTEDFASKETSKEIDSINNLRSQLADFFLKKDLTGILNKITLHLNFDTKQMLKCNQYIKPWMTLTDLLSTSLISKNQYTNKITLTGTDTLTKDELNIYVEWINGLIELDRRMYNVSYKMDENQWYNFDEAKEIIKSNGGNLEEIKKKALQGDDTALATLKVLQDKFNERATSAEAFQAKAKLDSGAELTKEEAELAKANMIYLNNKTFNFSNTQKRSGPINSIQLGNNITNINFGDGIKLTKNADSTATNKTTSVQATKNSTPVEASLKEKNQPTKENGEKPEEIKQKKQQESSEMVNKTINKDKTNKKVEVIYDLSNEDDIIETTQSTVNNVNYAYTQPKQNEVSLTGSIEKNQGSQIQ